MKENSDFYFSQLNKDFQDKKWLHEETMLPMSENVMLLGRMNDCCSWMKGILCVKLLLSIEWTVKFEF